MNVLLFNYLCKFIPCELCRNHYVKEIELRHNRQFNDADELFEWLWSVKNKVNARTKAMSIALDVLKKRFELHGRLIDEVALADTLVIMAIHAEESVRNFWPEFEQMCGVISRMLPCMNNLSLLKSTIHPNNWRTSSLKSIVFVEFVIQAAQAVRNTRQGILILQRSDYVDIMKMQANTDSKNKKRRLSPEKNKLSDVAGKVHFY